MGDLRFSDALLDQIRGAVSITEIVGQHVMWDKTKSNIGRRDMWACCPFHGEASPSFHADDSKGMYHCFGCGAAGDHFKFLMEQTGASFVDAVRTVAELAGISVPGSEVRERSPRASQEKPEPPELDDREAEPIQPPPDAPAGTMTAVKGYDYTDCDGNVLYQVVRYQWKLPDGSWVIDPKTGNPKKTFRQRRKDAAGNVVWNLEGIGHTIFRHPAVEIAIAESKTVVLCEGEKDVETLEAWGLAATTNSGGAQHWSAVHAGYFGGADVVILVDNDDAGRAGGTKRAMSLRGIAKQIRLVDFGSVIPDFPSKLDVTDWRDRFGGTSDQLAKIIERLPDWTPLPPPTSFGATRMNQLATSKIVYDWLIKGLIERGGVFIVAGEKQAGKSFFVIDLGMKIARGVDYADRKVKKGLVIHMACEDGKGVQMRAEGYRRDNGIPPDAEIPFLVMDRGFTLMSDESVDKFIAECLAWEEWYGIKLELVIIDTFSMATEGLDEIHSGEVGKVLGRVNRIASATKSAVCLVHHLNGEGKRVRGHSSLTANVSQVIEIRQMTKFQTNRNMPVEHIKDSDGRIVRQALLEKNKNGPNQLKWRFILRKVALGLDDDGYEISTCVCDTPSSDVHEGEAKATRLSQDQKLVLDALTAAIEDEGIDMPPGVRVGASVRKCATEKAFIVHVRKVWNFRADTTETEARNKELTDALKRNITALINAGYVGRDNDKAILWSLGKDDRPRPQPKPVEKAPPLPQDVRDALKDGVPF